MRELIQELDTLMIRELYAGVSTWDELDEEDRATVVEAWQKSITLILSAVRDGRLELPGEVGRGKMELFVGETQSCWAGFLLTEKPIANQPPTFIALRPLTGTDKGEE